MNIRRGPRPAADRLRRLLIMLPWLMERGEVSVAEVTARFDIAEADLVKDLELVAMCGLPPYVDELIDVFVDEGVVYTGVPRLFTAPLTLTAPEAFAVLASGTAAMQLVGAERDGALARALAKIRGLIGATEAHGDDGNELVVDSLRPPALAELTEAATSHRIVAMTYQSAVSDVATERRVVAQLVFADRGVWYFIGDDVVSGEARTFRIDRVVEWQVTSDIGRHRSVAPPKANEWFANAELPSVTLEVDRDSWPIIERLPMDVIEEPRSDDQRTRVRVVVTSEQWLERLLLRLGPTATVIEPDNWRGLGAAAARKVLARYE